MKIWKEAFWILLFSFLGEVLSKISHLPIPGSVIGMFLLFGALMAGLVKVEQMESTAKFLLENLSVFFLPATLGIMNYFNVLGQFWWQLLLILGGTTIVVQIIVGHTVQFVKRKFEGDGVQYLKTDTELTKEYEEMEMGEID
jgi:holin-like protein